MKERLGLIKKNPPQAAPETSRRRRKILKERLVGLINNSPPQAVPKASRRAAGASMRRRRANAPQARHCAAGAAADNRRRRKIVKIFRVTFILTTKITYLLTYLPLEAVEKKFSEKFFLCLKSKIRADRNVSNCQTHRSVGSDFRFGVKKSFFRHFKKNFFSGRNFLRFATW